MSTEFKHQDDVTYHYTVLKGEKNANRTKTIKLYCEVKNMAIAGEKPNFQPIISSHVELSEDDVAGLKLVPHVRDTRKHPYEYLIDSNFHPGKSFRSAVRRVFIWFEREHVLLKKPEPATSKSESSTQPEPVTGQSQPQSS